MIRGGRGSAGCSLGAGLKPSAGGLLSAVLCAEKDLERAGAAFSEAASRVAVAFEADPLAIFMGSVPPQCETFPRPPIEGRRIGGESGVRLGLEFFPFGPIAFRL